MKKRLAVLLLPLLLVGCAGQYGSMSWVNMPARGSETLQDAGLVFIQCDNTLKGARRSLEMARESQARKPSAKFGRYVDDLADAVAKANDQREVVEALGDHWYATGRYPPTWYDEQEKWIELLRRAEKAAERTYWRSVVYPQINPTKTANGRSKPCVHRSVEYCTTC